MVRVLVFAFGVLIGSSSSFAQQLRPAGEPLPVFGGPCDTSPGGLVYGCLDLVGEPGEGIYDDRPFYVHGWTLDCTAIQQPSHYEVWVRHGADWRQLGNNDLAIHWRLFRPDVGSFFMRVFRATGGRLGCPTERAFFGYRITIYPSAALEGPVALLVRFFSPSPGNGFNEQHQNIIVQPGPWR